MTLGVFIYALFCFSNRYGFIWGLNTDSLSRPTLKSIVYLRRTPPRSEALRHSGGERRRWTSATVTLYLEVELRRDRRPGTEQKRSVGEIPPPPVIADRSLPPSGFRNDTVRYIRRITSLVIVNSQYLKLNTGLQHIHERCVLSEIILMLPRNRIIRFHLSV